MLAAAAADAVVVVVVRVAAAAARLGILLVVVVGDDGARDVAHLDLLAVLATLHLAATVQHADDDEDERDEADDDAEDDVQHALVAVLARAVPVLVRLVAATAVIVPVTHQRLRNTELRRLTQKTLLLITVSFRVRFCNRNTQVAEEGRNAAFVGCVISLMTSTTVSGWRTKHRSSLPGVSTTSVHEILKPFPPMARRALTNLKQQPQ